MPLKRSRPDFRSVTSIDVDPDALIIATQNIAMVEMEDEITLIHARISNDPPTSPQETTLDIFDPVAKRDIAIFDRRRLEQQIDTVVMNPPFGSWTKGIDMVFLELATQVRARLLFRGILRDTDDRLIVDRRNGCILPA